MSPASDPSVADRSRPPPVWLHVLAFVAVLIVYFPALNGGFIWDDDHHVTRAALRSLHGLWRIWAEPGATQQYYPLLYSAFWLEHRLWGDAALPYHLVNALLHATAACLFAATLRHLAVPGAWLAAFLFLLHPVGVESVAWISEQKNTLSLVVYLSASLAYLRFDRERRPADYALSTTLFVLALLTKTVTATLPAAMLVVFWWRRGRLEIRRDVGPLLPWFILGAGGGLLIAYFERVVIGAEGEDFTLGFAGRLVLAGRVVWFYLGKLAWPSPLMFNYPRWAIEASVAQQWVFLIAAAAVLAVLAAGRHRTRAPLAVALLFVGSLFPELGFLNVYWFMYSYVADHFQYLPSLAVFALAAASVMRLSRRARFGVAGPVLLVLAVLTWRQAAMYRNVFTLYETTLAQNPDSWLAHNNLAMELTNAGRVAEAIPHLRKVLELRPQQPEALNNLGDDLVRLGQPVEGARYLEEALRVEPRFPEAHNNLGSTLLAQGRLAEARAHFEEAIRLNPDYAPARCNLGLALAREGRIAEAIVRFAQAVRIDPTYADAELNWGVGLTFNDRFAEAEPHFQRAIALAPTSAIARNSYGLALVRNNRIVEAAPHFQAALELDPNFADAHHNLEAALRQLGREEEADRLSQQDLGPR